LHDRRSDPRFRPVELKASLVRGEDAPALDVEVRDISRTGICLRSERPFPVGARCPIHLALDLGQNRQSEPLVLSVRIVWCTPFEGAHQLGAAFELSASQREELDALMFLVTRDVADEDGELRFRTGLHQKV